MLTFTLYELDLTCLLHLAIPMPIRFHPGTQARVPNKHPASALSPDIPPSQLYILHLSLATAVRRLLQDGREEGGENHGSTGAAQHIKVEVEGQCIWGCAWCSAARRQREGTAPAVVKAEGKGKEAAVSVVEKHPSAISAQKTMAMEKKKRAGLAAARVKEHASAETEWAINKWLSERWQGL